MAAITDAEIQGAIKKIKTGQRRRVTLSDGTGRGGGRLTLMARPAKAGVLVEWYATQHTNGRRSMSKIGVYPLITLSGARTAFAGYSVKIRQGIAVKHAKTAPDTLEAMLTAYCDQLDGRSADERRRVLIRAKDSAVNVIGAKKRACDVTTGDVVEWLRVFHARGSIGAAAYNRKTIRAAFTWALGSTHDYTTQGGNNWNLTTSPAALIPADPAANNSGERFLSRAEFLKLLAWLDASRDPLAKCVKLIAMTGQRVEEIAGLKARDYADGALFWEKTKVEKRPHYLPLPTGCRALLDGIKPTGGLYFPVNGKAATHPALRDVVKLFCTQTGTADFTTRDLRRTWKTLAGEAGVSKDARDLVQNHAKSGASSKHYDRYEYVKEKAAALDTWAAWVAA